MILSIRCYDLYKESVQITKNLAQEGKEGNKQMKIGIDIGGSHVGIGLVDEFGNIQQKKEKYIVEKIENESQINKQNLKEEIKFASKNVGQKDYKTVLQELLQKRGEANIEYKIIKELGPDHDKIFVSEVIYNGKILASGEGKSKKLAEMEAAKFAILKITEG